MTDHFAGPPKGLGETPHVVGVGSAREIRADFREISTALNDYRKMCDFASCSASDNVRLRKAIGLMGEAYSILPGLEGDD